MDSEQKNNWNPSNWINITLASFVPQMKEKGTYDAFVKLCVAAAKDDTLESVRKILLKYIELEDGEVYLVVQQIVEENNARLGIVS